MADAACVNNGEIEVFSHSVMVFDLAKTSVASQQYKYEILY